MKKILALAVVMMFTLSSSAFAGILSDEVTCDWFKGGALWKCSKKIETIKAASQKVGDTETTTTVTESDVVALFPNATKVSGIMGYLFNAKSLGVGAEYQIVKVESLVSLDAQFLSPSSGGGSYVGPAVEVSLCDIYTKLGKTCNATLAAVNPSVGMTIGYLSGNTSTSRSWDWGVRVGILNVDLSSAATTLTGILGL